MNTHVTPALGRLSADEFLEFIKDRPREERWQLIDGEPFVMMAPASLAHQRIGANLMRLLNGALEENRPDLFAMVEVGIKLESRPDFRPVADVAVVGSETADEIYATSFHLVAEVLSASNTREHISRKRMLYAEAPDCLHVLILSQRDFCVEVWSRTNAWQGRVFRSTDDVIEVPEFGFSCRVADLYRGTPAS